MAQPTYHVKRDKAGEYRWMLVAANGQTVATSGEGYTRKADCLHGITLVKASADAAIVEG